MGFSSTLKKLGMLGKLLFATNGRPSKIFVLHLSVFRPLQSIIDLATDRDAITISAPTMYPGSLQPLEIGATLASSLLNTSEFAFLAESSEPTPSSTGDAAGNANATGRRRGRSSVAQGTGSVDRTPLPHPLRASPTRASGAPRLPELKLQQAWSGDEFVVIERNGESDDVMGPAKVREDVAGSRPALRVVSVRPELEQRGSVASMPPPIPMRSPDRPGMPGAWSP